MSDAGATGKPVVVSVTGAREPHSRDMDLRVRRYLISMGIRTVCVILAVVVPGPLRWIFIVGAVGLPYVAVIMANAAAPRRRGRTGPDPVTRVALPAQAASRTIRLHDAGTAENPDRPTRQSAEWSSPGSDEWTP